MASNIYRIFGHPAPGRLRRLRELLKLVGGALGCLLVFSAPAHARINVGKSLECLAHSANNIGLFRIVEVEKEKRGGFNWYMLTGKLTTALKGEPPATIEFEYYDPYDQDEKNRKAPAVDHEFLIFSKDDNDPRRRIKHTINLSLPKTGGRNDVAFSRDGRVLVNKEEILSLVQKEIRKNANQPVKGCVQIEADGTEARAALYGGSTTYLEIPVDDELKAMLIKQLEFKHAWARAGAAYWMRLFPGKDTVELLRRLLRDPGVEWIRIYDNKREFEIARIPLYPVRHAAYLALLKIGEKPDKPDAYNDLFPLENYFGLCMNDEFCSGGFSFSAEEWERRKKAAEKK